jgi:hypothetical protein
MGEVGTDLFDATKSARLAVIIDQPLGGGDRAYVAMRAIAETIA